MDVYGSNQSYKENYMVKRIIFNMSNLNEWRKKIREGLFNKEVSNEEIDIFANGRYTYMDVIKILK